MKRTSPSQEDGDLSSKRRKLTVVKHHALSVKQPGAELLLQNPQDTKVIEDELTKAICVILYNIGFTNIRTGALESFRALIQEYMTHFCARIVHSMTTCRRRQPLPQDFINALAQFDLTPSSLEPDLHVPAPPAIFQTPVQPPPPEPPTPPSLEPILRDELSGAAEKKLHQYVPSHFPSFPSQHAYKDTAIYVQRETDARKIREQATQEGMLAEQALRKLMRASKAGRRRPRWMDEAQAKKNEEVWQEALSAAAGVDRSKAGETQRELDEQSFGLDGAGDDELARLEMAGPVVNYDRAHWRMGMRGRA